MGRYEFVGVLAVGHVADLRTRFDGLQTGLLVGVPYLDGLVGGTPSGGQDGVLVGRPCQCLHSR